MEGSEVAAHHAKTFISKNTALSAYFTADGVGVIGVPWLIWGWAKGNVVPSITYPEIPGRTRKGSSSGQEPRLGGTPLGTELEIRYRLGG